jgi:hypothetical protein
MSFLLSHYSPGSGTDGCLGTVRARPGRGLDWMII